MARISYLAVVLVVTAYMIVKQGKASICGEPVVQRIGVECNGFTGGKYSEPSAECCNAYRAVRSRLNTTAKRREYCSCAHRVISQYPDSAARIPRIDSLPKKCRVPFLFSGDPKFNCNT